MKRTLTVEAVLPVRAQIVMLTLTCKMYFVDFKSKYLTYL